MKIVSKILISLIICNLFCCSSLAQIKDSDVKKIYALGKSLGASFYYLNDTLNKSIIMPYSDIENEYGHAFEELNITEVILNDINQNFLSINNLKSTRYSFYNALTNRDLGELKLKKSSESFNCFYQKLLEEISVKYDKQGVWLLNIAFYLNFQEESINSENKEKLLLSGFEQIVDDYPFVISKEVYSSMNTIEKLDKSKLTFSEMEKIKNSINKINNFFENYNSKNINYNQEIIGNWQGIMVNPDNKKFDIILKINSDLSGNLNIKNLAYNIKIPKINLNKNYFTLTFAPFGTKKLYIRFNGKIYNNTIKGRVIDILGDEGYWVLAKTNNSELELKNFDNIISCISQIEQKIKKDKNIIEVNNFESKLTIKEFEANYININPKINIEVKNPTLSKNIFKKDFIGDWKTSIKLQGQKYKFKLKITPENKNSLVWQGNYYPLKLEIQGENIYFVFEDNTHFFKKLEFYGKYIDKKHLEGAFVYQGKETKTKVKRIKKRKYWLF